MILAHARERKLVDIHVAGQIIERVRKAVDRQLGHGDRQRRLGGYVGGERHRGIEGLAGIGHFFHQPPFISFGSGDALVGRNDRRLEARLGLLHVAARIQPALEAAEIAHIGITHLLEGLADER